MNYKKNIMITGGAGFIGSHVVRLFVNKYPDYRIVNIDKLTYAGNLANLKDVAVAGKTGTAQNPHGKDHSAFIGFAPYDDPKIAICVYVENAGFGAKFGVHIVSFIMDKYLNDSIAPERKYIEQRMFESNTIISSGVKKH